MPPQAEWKPSWTGSIKASDVTEYKEHMSQLMAWMPYILCGLILVVTRVPYFGLKRLMNGALTVGCGAKVTLGWPSILGVVEKVKPDGTEQMLSATFTATPSGWPFRSPMIF